MSERSREKGLAFELQPRGLPAKIWFHLVRWGLLVGLATLTYLLYPVKGGFETPLPAVGDVAPVEVIAPFEFEVRKPVDDIQAEADARALSVQPVYEYRPEIVDSVIARANAVFQALGSATAPADLMAIADSNGIGLTFAEAEYLLANRRLSAFLNAVRIMARRQLARGVPAPNTVEAEPSARINERRPNEPDRLVSRDSVFTYGKFLDSRVTAHPAVGSPIADRIFRKLLVAFFQPTLEANAEATEALRAEMRATVDSVGDVVRRNERIVDANEVVTPDIYDRLVELRNQRLRLGEGEEASLLVTIGQILTNALVLALFWALLMLFLPEMYASLRHMSVLALVFGLVILGAGVVLRFISGDPAPELIPIPFAAMLVTILFGGRLAMVSAMVLAVLLGSQVVYGGEDALFIALVGGMAAALSVRSIRRRNQLLMSVTAVTIAFLLAGVTVGLRNELGAAEMGLTGVLGGVNILASAALVLLTLPLFESASRITTDLTLLELSDPNRPLLRRLATEIPGTYAHSVTLANLCEAACNAIGAHGLLARVGCYYHDVGKLKKPQYFVENQGRSENPHDKLKPDVSASIIRNHVQEGITLAEEHNLPEAIKAFIPEHHGTAEITYFLDRARSQDPEAEIDPAQFRYPGPKPQSVETAVVMLGDSVEAALRVLEQPTEEKLRDAIDHLVQKRIESGELDEAPLTLAQVVTVKQEFLRVFAGMHHNRIDYPASTGGITAGWDAGAK